MASTDQHGGERIDLAPVEQKIEIDNAKKELLSQQQQQQKNNNQKR